MMLGAWAVVWLTTYKKDTVASNTYTGYEYMLRHITDSSIGKIPLTDVKPVHIIRFLSGKKNTSHSMVTKLKAFLYAIFEAAIENDLCLKNPAKNAKVPTIAEDEKEAFTDAEVDTIKEFATTEKGKPFELAINKLIYTGLRRGELLGLMWEDIDLVNSILNLRRAVSFGENNDLVTGGSNSRKNHNRDIPFKVELGLLFQKEKERNCRAKGLYIFCTKSGGLLRPENFDRSYHAFLKI